MICSGVQNGEFHFGFKEFIKIVRVGDLQIENTISKQKNCKIEFLVVLSHWGWGPGATEVLHGYFLALGRMTYSHIPNQFFI